MSPAVYLIVLTYNGKALVLEALDSILQIDYDNLHIVVVDNGGRDGTPDAVRQRYGDRVHLIVIKDNIKYSRANNEGIRWALEQNADYIMLLNDDIVVDPGLVRALVDVAGTDPKIGAVGPKIYYYAERDRIWFAGGRVHLSRGTTEHIGIREIDGGQYDVQRDVDYLTGCALMMRRRTVERVGALDPQYLAYYEDTDWCMRARRAGFRLVYVPSGRMWHKISATTGGQLTRYKIRHKLRSGRIFFGSYARWYHWLTIPLFQIADLARVALLITTGKLAARGRDVKA
jgi:GT2 family glycosyltransferase